MAIPTDPNKRHYMFTDDIKFLQKVVIYNTQDNTFLILKRAAYHPTRPNEWDLPGGNVAFGQKHDESLLQEIQEETQLEVTNIKPINVVTKFDKGIYFLYIGYKAEAITYNIVLSKEHVEYRWVTKEEFFELNPADFLKNLVNLT